MSENQAMMSLGEVMVPSSNSTNRSINFNNNDRPVKVVFENNNQDDLGAIDGVRDLGPE